MKASVHTFMVAPAFLCANNHSLLSRRGVYCSKYPNSEFSVTQFDDAEGNIRYRNIKHSWVNGKCKFCGTSKSTVLGKC